MLIWKCGFANFNANVNLQFENCIVLIRNVNVNFDNIIKFAQCKFANVLIQCELYILKYCVLCLKT